MRLIIVLAFVVFASTAVSQMSLTVADEGNAKPLFKDKVVTIYTSSGKNSGDVLTNVKLQMVGGRMMITGIGADTGGDDDWTKGAEVGFPWETVTAYIAMTPEQFKKARANRLKDKLEL